VPVARPESLSLVKWSGSLNVPDPVACAVDPQGRVYVAATTRRKVGDLDIREHRMWIPDDVGLTSVADKSAFYRRELAPGKMRLPRGMLKDHNADGSIDWQDLTFHTERIYQLRDTDDDGVADRMTVFAEGFNTEVTGIAAGVLYHDGWVYATIAPDLWRFKDTDDDGVADVREVVAHGFGVHLAYAGHDMHGLSVGPDGRIYWSIGDKGSNVTSKEGKIFYHPNEGAVFRVEPDGSGFEVYAHGLRNPQEPAFDDFGDLFVVDNDADMKGERERFVYVLEGSDSGWRSNFQYMAEASPWMVEGYWKPQFDGQAAHHLPPILNYSDGPAGFRHDPGTALSAGQRGMFLLNEFPSGKMKGFRVEPVGASFKMVDARILNEGIMGIGMSWHPDGSLMMVDWIGGYPLDGLGALWRVDAHDAEGDALRGETLKLLRAGFAQRTSADLLNLIGHADQRVRQGAQFELAKKGEWAALLALAKSGDRALLARVHGIWGVGQLLRTGQVKAETVVVLLKDKDPEIRRQVVRILGDAPSAKTQSTAVIPLLADESARVRVQAALALGKWKVPAAVDALWTMAESAQRDPVLRHAAVTGLAGCASAERLAAMKTSPSPTLRMAGVLALRRQASPAVAAFLADADPLIVAEAVRAIHDERSIPAALPEVAALLGRPLPDETVTRRAINANFRVGQSANAERLVAYGLNEAAPRAARASALTALQLWPQPPRLDLVDGYARQSNPAAVQDVLSPRLGELLALSDPGLKTLAIQVMIAHSLPASPEQILAIVGDRNAPGELRAQSLRLMGGEQRKSPAFAQAVDLALEEGSPAALYRVGLEALLPEQVERLVREAMRVFVDRGVPEKQHAIALLARSERAAADEVLRVLASTLLAGGNWDPELTLDLVEALGARSPSSPALAAALKSYTENPSGKSQGELLAGGSSELGEKIVDTHLNANCLACHSLTREGGSEVGPNLRFIGSERSREYLLESLLNPSAAIATGFGLVTVTLKDGTTVSGTLAKETKDAVTVRQFDGKFQSVSRDQIKDRSAAVSIMPPMAGVLQPRELRDVVAYLASLKKKPVEPRQAKADEGQE